MSQIRNASDTTCKQLLRDGGRSMQCSLFSWKRSSNQKSDLTGKMMFQH